MTTTTTIIRLTSEKHKAPGPGEYEIKSTIGKEGTHPTLGGRPKSSHKHIDAPLENIGSTIGTGPKFSLRSRPKDPKTESTSPGPSYMPPSFGSNAPHSAFHGRSVDRRSNLQGPGPGEYAVPSTIGEKARGYTLKARRFPPAEEGTVVSPGPSAYEPNYKAAMNHKPAPTFHGRTEVKSREPPTPGPGAYDVKHELSTKTSTFHARPKPLKSQDVSPGPAAYDNTDIPLGKDAKKFSIRPRIEQHKPCQAAPYQALPSTVGNAPKYSFGQRTTVRDLEPTPGPSYMPPAFGSGVKSSSFHGRYDTTAKKAASTPGPGEYVLNSTVGEGKKFTMKARRFVRDEGESSGPGPAAYDPKSLESVHAPTIHNQIKSKKKESSPGYDYVPQFGTDGPKITIGRRETLACAPGVV